MTLFIPPESIMDLVHVKSGQFVIDANATPAQVAEFEKWRNEVEAIEQESEGEPLS